MLRVLAVAQGFQALFALLTMFSRDRLRLSLGHRFIQSALASVVSAWFYRSDPKTVRATIISFLQRAASSEFAQSALRHQTVGPVLIQLLAFIHRVVTLNAAAAASSSSGSTNQVSATPAAPEAFAT